MNEVTIAGILLALTACAVAILYNYTMRNIADLQDKRRIDVTLRALSTFEQRPSLCNANSTSWRVLCNGRFEAKLDVPLNSPHPYLSNSDNSAVVLAIDYRGSPWRITGEAIESRRSRPMIINVPPTKFSWADCGDIVLNVDKQSSNDIEFDSIVDNDTRYYVGFSGGICRQVKGIRIRELCEETWDKASQRNQSTGGRFASGSDAGIGIQER